MKRNILRISGLAILMAAGCYAQPVTLNVLPSRIVGHGQPETTTIFTANPNLVDGREMFSPEGIALDTSVSPPILYVADTGNNRVLAWKNASTFQNGQMADLVIGQQDFYHTFAQGPAGTFQSGMANPTGLAVDSKGNLYVADSNNNRILRYPSPFSQSAQSGSVLPDLWIGQPSPGSNSANFTGAVAQQGLSLASSPFPISIAFDGSGNLWVTDSGNRRVLRFPSAQVAAGGGPLTPDLELGQLDFVSTTQPQPTTSAFALANSFAIPVGIAFDPAGNLYVSDSLANVTVGRVLVFQPPFSNGQGAVRLLGVPSSASSDGVDKTFMETPSAIFFVPAANVMGVVDTFSSRILFFPTFANWPAATTTTVSPLATAVLGQAGFHNRVANGGGTYVPAPSAATLTGPFAAAFSGTELFVADSGNSRIAVFPLASGATAPAPPFGPASRILGQYTVTMSAPNLVEGREVDFVYASSSGTAADGGLAIDPSGSTPHLYVADTYNNRVLGFNDFRSLVAGAKADLVIGQPDFNSTLCNVTGNPNAPTQASLCRPTGLAVDPINGDLYVADTTNSRVLRFPAPFAHVGTTPEQADLVLGQGHFNLAITDPTSSTMAAPYGLAIAANNGLLVSDITHNRVLYFPFTANNTFVAGTDNGKAATKVFGQQNFNSTTAGSASTSLNTPHHIAADNEARLYVADAGNNRLMVFDQVGGSLTQSTGAQAIFQIGGLSSPRSVSVNQVTSQIWVGDTSGTVKEFTNYANLILESPITTLATVAAPSAGVGLAQDQYGNLALADATNRVAFYFPALQAVNGGSFLTDKYMAPGMLATLFAPCTTNPCAAGQSIFGPNTATNAALPNPYPMPTTLGDLQVLFNGTAVPLYYVSPMQINFVVPMKAPTSGTADIQVIQASTNRVYAENDQVPMAPVSPAILMTQYSGSLRQAAVINVADGSVNSASNPAARGTYISVYATGEGFVPNAPADGTPPSGPIAAPVPLRVNIGGIYLDQMLYDSSSDVPQSQWLSYSGLSTFPGLWQINIYLPHAIVANKQIPLIIVADQQTNTDVGTFNVTIGVK